MPLHPTPLLALLALLACSPTPERHPSSAPASAATPASTNDLSASKAECPLSWDAAAETFLLGPNPISFLDPNGQPISHAASAHPWRSLPAPPSDGPPAQLIAFREPNPDWLSHFLYRLPCDHRGPISPIAPADPTPGAPPTLRFGDMLATPDPHTLIVEAPDGLHLFDLRTGQSARHIPAPPCLSVPDDQQLCSPKIACHHRLIPDTYDGQTLTFYQATQPSAEGPHHDAPSWRAATPFPWPPAQPSAHTPDRWAWSPQSTAHLALPDSDVLAFNEPGLPALIRRAHQTSGAPTAIINAPTSRGAVSPPGVIGLTTPDPHAKPPMVFILTAPERRPEDTPLATNALYLAPDLDTAPGALIPLFSSDADPNGPYRGVHSDGRQIILETSAPAHSEHATVIFPLPHPAPDAPPSDAPAHLPTPSPQPFPWTLPPRAQRNAPPPTQGLAPLTWAQWHEAETYLKTASADDGCAPYTPSDLPMSPAQRAREAHMAWGHAQRCAASPQAGQAQQAERAQAHIQRLVQIGGEATRAALQQAPRPPLNAHMGWRLFMQAAPPIAYDWLSRCTEPAPHPWLFSDPTETRCLSVPLNPEGPLLAQPFDCDSGAPAPALSFSPDTLATFLGAESFRPWQSLSPADGGPRFLSPSGLREYLPAVGVRQARKNDAPRPR